jgi:hypothetical protein
LKLLRDHLLEAATFVLVFGLAAYFYNGYGWNQTARYDPIWAWVEPGPHQHTFEIDAFLIDPETGLNTGDFARDAEHSPHYYSNKAPGTSLLGIPAYFALYHGERLLGFDPVSVTGVLVNAYLINLWVTVLPVALSAILFLQLASFFTGERRRAILLTLVLYAGTLMLPFSTALWGHTTAAAFVVMAVACFVIPVRGRSRGRDALSGLFMGLAVLTDYGAAPLALLVVIASLLDTSRRERLSGLVLGGLGPLLVFGLYHWHVFGSPFVIASSFSPPEMIDEDRVSGLFGALSLQALWGLTLSSSRGLFVYMPVLAVSLYAIIYRRGGNDPTFWRMAVASMLLILAINATFNGWHGGVSTGPRYQIVVLPFWVLLLALLPAVGGVQRVLHGLAGVSFINMFVVAAVSPMAPDAFRGSPLFFCYAKLVDVLRIDIGVDPEPIAASLSSGSLHMYPTYHMRGWSIPLTDPVIERWASFNLGELLFGLSGVVSLLPALLGFAALAIWMSRRAAAEDGERPAGQ